MLDRVQVKIVNSIIRKLPSYATNGSAGLDLRAAIDENIILESNKTILIPTDPNNKKKDTNNTIINIKRAALAYINKENIKIKQKAIDKGKFDYSEI